jgi:hypothetical protein
MWSRCDCYGIRNSIFYDSYITYIGEISVIASLGAMIALLCLIVVGTLSALLVITHKYYKKGIVIIVCIHLLDGYCLLITQVEEIG